MKSKGVETAKKYGPEHCIRPWTGLKQPKKTKIDQIKEFGLYFTKQGQIDGY